MMMTARRKWTREEEGALRSVVDALFKPAEHTYPPWPAIAEKLTLKTRNIRTAKACSTRWARMCREEKIRRVAPSDQDQLLRDIADAVMAWLRSQGVAQ